MGVSCLKEKPRAANYRFSSLSYPPLSVTSNMQNCSERCEEKQIEQIVEIL